ncbi:MAG TPA: ParB/RepB/Spo0J family partition protein [Anaerolineales bacterium]|nr:ParB/RepB/Spo0J family partition protein [Anaerolineales bacterium]
MTKKHGLGRGLDALIPTGDLPPEAAGGVLRVSPDMIIPNPRQPRTSIHAADLQALAASIRLHGVLQPLIVTPNPDGAGYILIAGERRLEAARLAGLEAVPVVVRMAAEQERLELALIENLQREDLNPLEAAQGYHQLVDDFGLTHEEAARRLGKSRAAISNTLRLLRLPPAIRQALANGSLSEGHARALLALPTPQAQSAAAQTILRRGLNVRQTEELVQRLTGQRRRTTKARRRSPEEVDLEDRLRQALGTRVLLRRGRKGGSLVIRFFSDEELDAIVDRLLER